MSATAEGYLVPPGSPVGPAVATSWGNVDPPSGTQDSLSTEYGIGFGAGRNGSFNSTYSLEIAQF
jgi:hypothetical protein